MSLPLPEIKKIKIIDLSPNLYNPQEMPKDKYKGLVGHMRSVGFTDPLKIRLKGVDDPEIIKTPYVLVDGEHRLRAFMEVFSDEDEIGTVHVQITVGDTIFDVFNSHPDGSDDAKLIHSQTLMSHIGFLSNVISMGDFNSRENSTYYNASTAVLIDSFLYLYPDHFDENGVNRTRRIDHIFVSPKFIIKEAHYISSPESQTDHPVHWIVIEF